MSESSERDYILGTHDEELQRLGRQHAVWQDTVIRCWRNAGIRPGFHVVDIGAGPGYATYDLATCVGPEGTVAAIEQSRRFLSANRQKCQSLPNVTCYEHDLMSSDPLPVTGADASWCRWVGSFVPSPETLVRKISQALRPGGLAIFHEYVDYRTFRLIPDRPAIHEFVERVMASWREAGGEPNVARRLPALLCRDGRFSLRHALPLVLSAHPGQPVWDWPAEFIEIHLRRMQQLGHGDEAWTARVRSELTAAENDPHSIMITPMLLEIVAIKLPPPANAVI